MQSVEERLSKLEEAVFGSRGRKPGKDDWQKTVGTVTDDEVSREIIEGAIRLREAEREQARQEDAQDEE